MKLFCASLFVLFTTNSIFAQTKPNATKDAVPVDTVPVYTVSLGLNYGNTPNYYGQTTAVKLGYVSADVSFDTKLGFYTGVSAVKLFDIDQAVSEVDVSVGYRVNITKKLGASASYTRFFFAKDSPLPQSVNPNTASLSLDYDFTWLNAGLYSDYVFGGVKDEQGKNVKDYYLTFLASKTINLGSINKEKDYFTLSPSINFVGGTQRVGGYETKQVGTTPPRTNRLGLPLPGTGGRPIYETTYVESSNFGLITTGLSFPLAYNRASYKLEAAYLLSIPNKNFAGIVHENQSFFTVGFTYYFDKYK